MSNRNNIDYDLSKAWQTLSESIIMPEAGLNPMDDVGEVKQAEVMGKASPIDKINGIIYNVINSEKAKQLILRRIATSISEMFYEHLTGKEYLSEYDLSNALKKMIGAAIPNLESYLTQIDEELEYGTDYFNILNDKIAELAESHMPALLQKYHQYSKAKNTK
jgi:hypothetical protein